MRSSCVPQQFVSQSHVRQCTGIHCPAPLDKHRRWSTVVYTDSLTAYHLLIISRSCCFLSTTNSASTPAAGRHVTQHSYQHACRNNTGDGQPSWQSQTSVAQQLHGEPITHQQLQKQCTATIAYGRPAARPVPPLLSRQHALSLNCSCMRRSCCLRCKLLLLLQHSEPVLPASRSIADTCGTGSNRRCPASCRTHHVLMCRMGSVLRGRCPGLLGSTQM
jgi:hypothetical protein